MFIQIRISVDDLLLNNIIHYTLLIFNILSELFFSDSVQYIHCGCEQICGIWTGLINIACSCSYYCRQSQMSKLSRTGLSPIFKKWI